jgi:hypothetical protein
MTAHAPIQVTTEAKGFTDPVHACEWAIRQISLLAVPGDMTLMNITQCLGADLDIEWSVRISVAQSERPDPFHQGDLDLLRTYWKQGLGAADLLIDPNRPKPVVD